VLESRTLLPERSEGPTPGTPTPLEATTLLLARYRAGDERARDHLIARYLPVLRRWAHGRLPAGARALADTEDLVQISLVRALNHMGTFEPKHEGAFLVYLRRIFINAMRDEIRRSHRERRGGQPDEEYADSRPNALEQAIGSQALEAYEAGLALRGVEQREAVVVRLEFGMPYDRIAEAMGKPSANAARMVVSRAILRLAEAMNDHRS
jgi:RNA polymerase sigma-70 factor (ECF subfamily)